MAAEQRVGLSYSTRRASIEDIEFAYNLTKATMREHVEAIWGAWCDDEKREHHRRSFDLPSSRIVLVDETPIGVVAVERHAAHVQLEKLLLLPAFTNQGLGSSLLREVLAAAFASRKPVQLRVLRVNIAAQRFYERHGFVIVSSTPERCFMEAARHV